MTDRWILEQELPEAVRKYLEQVAGLQNLELDWIASEAKELLAALPAQEREVVALTRLQIAQGFKSYPQYAYGAFEDGVRFAEKHHGIAAPAPKEKQ